MDLDAEHRPLVSVSSCSKIVPRSRRIEEPASHAEFFRVRSGNFGYEARECVIESGSETWPKA